MGYAGSRVYSDHRYSTTERCDVGAFLDFFRWAFDWAAKLFGWGARSKHDRELFDEFLDALPSNGNVKFIDEYDFLFGDFHRHNISQIKDFLETWNDAEHEFVNKKLEKKRQELFGRLKKFLDVLVVATVPVGNGKKLSVFPDNQPRKNDEGHYLPHLKEDARKTNDAAKGIFKLHQDFIREAKKRLKV